MEAKRKKIKRIKKLNILHVVTDIITNGGVETYLKSLINTTTGEYNHIICVFPKCYDGKSKIDKKVINSHIVLDSIYAIKTICEEKNIDIVFIHWIGSRCFDRNSRTIQKGEILYIDSDREPDYDNHPAGYCLSPFLFPAWENTGEYKIVKYKYNGRIHKKNIPLRVKNTNKPKFVIVSHCDDRLPDILSNLYVDAVISPSCKVKRKQLHVNTEHLSIYNSVSFDKIKPYKKKHDKIVITWVGSLNKYDISIYEYIKKDKEINEKCDFIYIGKGALDKNPPDNHIFLGEVPHDKVFDHLAYTDIFLYPTLYDSFGIALAEAMMCGVPIVASLVVSEIVGNAGFVCKLNSEYVSSLLTFINTPRISNHFGNEAKKQSVNNYSQNVMIGKYKMFIKSLMEK